MERITLWSKLDVQLVFASAFLILRKRFCSTVTFLGTAKCCCEVLLVILSKSSNKVSAKVHGGYLSGKERRKLIDNNILTLVRIFVMANKLPAYYELEPYCRFESDDGQKFFSLGTKTRKTDSTVIEYFDRNNALCYGRVTHFLKIHDFGLCVVNELEENSEPLLFFNERDCIETLQSLTDDKQ